MKNRKGRAASGKGSVIFIAMILFIGLMGVGYAKWNKETAINAGVETGYIRPLFSLKNDALDFGDGQQLEFSLSEDGSILYIDGEVYPDFDYDIPIEVIDEGSVPSVFRWLDGYGGGISDLRDNTDVYTRRSYGRMGKKDAIGSFRLNIGEYENAVYRDRDGGYSVYSRDTSGSERQEEDLEREIDDLWEEIRQYDNIGGTYNFEYKLDFEQDI